MGILLYYTQTVNNTTNCTENYNCWMIQATEFTWAQKKNIWITVQFPQIKNKIQWVRWNTLHSLWHLNCGAPKAKSRTAKDFFLGLLPHDKQPIEFNGPINVLLYFYIPPEIFAASAVEAKLGLVVHVAFRDTRKLADTTCDMRQVVDMS